MPLVVADRSDRLLTHCTLIRVSWRLVVMRVRNQSGDDSKDAEWLDFHVSCLLLDALFVEGNQGVDLLVDIQVLDEAFP